MTQALPPVDPQRELFDTLGLGNADIRIAPRKTEEDAKHEREEAKADADHEREADKEARKHHWRFLWFSIAIRTVLAAWALAAAFGDVTMDESSKRVAYGVLGGLIGNLINSKFERPEKKK